MTNGEYWHNYLEKRDWEDIADRLEAVQRSIAASLSKMEKLQKSVDETPKAVESKKEVHKHFAELCIAGRVDGVVRCKELFRFRVAVKDRLHPLDNQVQYNYFSIYLEGNALEKLTGKIHPGDYISLRAKIRAYMGWGEPYGNPISAWSSPVQLYIDDPAQIVEHKICSKDDKHIIGMVVLD